jgi:(2S)-methylsuccinyl-CoA dehydrogenase
MKRPGGSLSAAHSSVPSAAEPTATAALAALERVLTLATARLRFELVDPSGRHRIEGDRLEDKALASHGLAWLATEVAAARALLTWALGSAGPLDERIADAHLGSLFLSLRGGLSLGPCEEVSLEDLGLTTAEVEAMLGDEALLRWSRRVASADAWCAIADAAGRLGTFGSGFGESAANDDDVTLAAIQGEMRRFTDRAIAPIAQDIHREDILVPMELVDELGRMGVFGLTIPEAYGGQGLGKLAMCVVTEELSRGSLGIGSLGTRAEIAAELILAGGTEAQRTHWLPRIATGEVIPTAVFTEPDFGSDLAHARSRAERLQDGSYSLHGQKTWITHATRADLMTALFRTDAEKPGYEGLSMFLAPKQRATVAEAFPDEGLTGSEIKVIGYRGMKEFELSFDGFRVDGSALLGGREGAGFKQLMATFESARIQTAARAVGVAQAALEAAMRYAGERVQFGRPIAAFRRTALKLGRAIASVAAARKLTHFAARAKDSGARCDLEAGMAKLFATRVAWQVADACVQIHGGNGYAEEFSASRLLLDARVLSIFEGASEIQAQVVARRLIER